MLREARMRRRIDMTEVESATKIRGKYLRALENEEWDLLPGPTFVKTFLRTYAEYLDLDPRLLVEEYRQRYERPSTQDLTPFSATRARGRARRRRAVAVGPAAVIVVCAALLLGALWALGRWGGSHAAGRRRRRPSSRCSRPGSARPWGRSRTRGPARRPR